MRYFAVTLASILMALQSPKVFIGQKAVPPTLSITCRCDDDGKIFAELLVKKFATTTYAVVSAAQKSAAPAMIRIVITSHQLSRFGTQLKSTSGDETAVHSVMTNSASNREPVLSTISVECTFAGGRFVEEIKRCDRVGLISIAEEVAADMTAALQMEPTEAEDAA